MRLAKYIGQLIQDLERVEPPAVVGPVLDLESADEHERLLFRPDLEEAEDTKWQHLGTWLDLDRIQFPPVEQLEKSLLARLIDAMIGATSRLNISFVFPHDLPLARRYALLLTYWEEEVPYNPTGQWTIDFCAGWVEDCVLGDYCTCKQYGEPLSGHNFSAYREPIFWGGNEWSDTDTDTDTNEGIPNAEEEEEMRYLDRLRSEFEDELGEEE